MALTKCLECGGQVSTHADACPHCGFPMEKQRELETKRTDGWNPPQYEKCPVCLSKYDNITGRCDVCGFTGESLRPKPKTSQSVPNLPKCPVCGSTRLTKISAVGRLATGFVYGGLSPEGRVQYVCQSCDYKF